MTRPIVYGAAMSPYVWSVRLTLAEKGVAHDEQGPAIADDREGPRHRAFHLAYFRPSHDWFFFRSDRERVA